MVKKIYPKSNFEDFPQEWEPKTNGIFFKNFLDGLSDDFDKKFLTHETRQILGACPKPTLNDYYNHTQLVLGKVQSGKTTSFNSVISLALDNGFDLVILLGGRSNQLLKQNRNELKNNLLSKNIADNCHILSSHKEDGGAQVISGFSIKPIKFGAKYLFVIMKQQDHLDYLAKLLSKARKELKDVNTLIIDDEADNASLNTLINDDDIGAESRIYNSIKNLRQSIPRHSLLQYTATPQSLLLTSATDQYRPLKARFVTPGKGYIGNSELFYENSSSIINVQETDEDIKKFDDPITELPNQFINVLNAYLLVCAETFIKKDIFDKNVTMLVHPSSSKKTHRSWGDQIKKYLRELEYDIDDNSIDFNQKHQMKFKNAYNDLTYETKNISQFKSLYEFIPKVITYVSSQVIVLNSDPDSDRNITWDLPFNILVGGNMLDRGFVVKGLAITYMPRSKGQGNIDTIQQRGRFFGYKEKYIDYIKIWLKDDTINVFSTYAKHEQLLWEDLKMHSRKDLSLDDWRRRFLIDPDMRLTRDNVIGRKISTSHISSNNWYYLRRPYYYQKMKRS